MSKENARWLVLIVFATLTIWGFGVRTIGDRLTTALEGDIISERFIPRDWITHGTGMNYIVRAPDGTDQLYTAGGTDSSLPRNLPVGAHIVKRRWELSYSLNGKRIDDFPIYFYSTVTSVACALLVWAGLRWSRRHG